MCRRSEVVGPPGEVSLKEIVRLYPNAQQTEKKFFQRLQIVIDPLEQNRLTPHWYPGIGQHCTGQARFAGDFVGMIEVGVDVERMMGL